MTDTVTCAECGHHYDSEQHTFCPSCGHMGSFNDLGSARDLADRRDPRKRPVQAAGIVLVAFGALMLLTMVPSLFALDTITDEALHSWEAQPGGDIAVQVVGPDPVEGADVTVRSMSGAPLRNGTTDAAGWVNFTAIPNATTMVVVDYSGGSWERQVLAIEDLHAGESAQVVRIDTEEEASTDDWVGAELIPNVLRILLIVFTVVAAVTIWGGIAAIRVTSWQTALVGAAIGLLPWLLVAVATLHWVSVLIAVMFVWCLYIFWRHRGVFTSRQPRA